MTLPLIAGAARASLADDPVYTAISPDEIAFRDQIERNWNINSALIDQCREMIELRVALAPDGTVTKVDILQPGGPAAECRPAAEAARRAVLIASPFKVPSGTYPPSIKFRLSMRNVMNGVQ
nr:hypothetical protein [uncultured Dongia sp.]